MTETWQPDSPSHFVTAVLVAHNGERWLPACLATLGELTREPDVVVAVDTGSSDGTAELLHNAFGENHVVTAGPDEGFGAAIERGLERAAALAAANPGQHSWVWLIHDDCAPAPDALRALLATADELPDVSVIGPKLRGWHDRRLLLEVGVTVTGSGRRETGLERAETDQGQHDGVRDVLAVGSAGMLVRRELWDRLDGFDPALPLFRDDIDFCWRAHASGARVVVSTDAVVHHAEAATRSRRELDAVLDRPHLVDRAHSLYVTLVHAPAWALPLILVRQVVGTMLRVVGFLLAKSALDAQDDLAALGLLLLRPDRVWVGRSRLRRIRTVPRKAIRKFLAPRWLTARHAIEAFAGTITTSSQETPYLSAIESGPTGDDADFLAPTGFRRVVRRPAIVLVLCLLALTAFAARHSIGFGVPAGGALLPTPDSAAALWQSFLTAWHDVGPGSAVPGDPYLVVLAVLSAVTLGHAAWVVAGILWLGPALAGLSGYLALRGIVSSRWVRVWAASTYALLPAVVGADVTGRLGTLVLAMLLPATARVMARAIRSWRAAWAAGLLLAVAASFVPGVLLAVPILVIAVCAAVVRERGAWARLLAASLTPIVVTMPWSLWILAHPAELLFEAGLKSGVGLADANMGPWHVALLHPGGAGMAPTLTSAGLLLASVVAGLRVDTRERVLAAWSVGVVAIVLGLVQVRLRAEPVGAGTGLAAWPGPATLIVGASAILATVTVTTGLRTRMRRASFGLSQPTTVALLAMLLLTPISSAAWWATHPRAVVKSGTTGVLPDFVQAQSGPPDRPRTLLLGSDHHGRIRYSLLPGAGARLGDAEVVPPTSSTAALDSAVAGLAAGRVGGDAATLVSYGVRYVLVSDATDTLLLGRLDLAAGLRRVAASDGSALWVLDPSPPRAYVTGSPVTPLQWTDQIGGTVPTATGPRLLRISAPADPGWSAAVENLPLQRVLVDGWAQAFTVPESGGQLFAGFGQGSRRHWLWFELALVAIVVTLALPGRRREAVVAEADVFGEDPVAHVAAAPVPAELTDAASPIAEESPDPEVQP